MEGGGSVSRCRVRWVKRISRRRKSAGVSGGDGGFSVAGFN